MTALRSAFTHLRCSRCRAVHPGDQLQNLCACGSPLLAQYDLAVASLTLKPDRLAGRRTDLWRYTEVLPGTPEEILTLGEGGTPLVRLHRLEEEERCPQLYLKDEAFNPTGSFKARGLAVAVARAKSLGARKLALPTAGNAGGALAAYAARAGLEAFVLMPKDAPAANQLECRAHGAGLILVDGLISDCARLLAERREREGWFDLSTLKEPYRVEGKKTLGYELFEQLGGRLPAAILYPTGGGVGLIGMWKAFDEMETLGWIGSERPKMIVVQASGCAPLVRAFEAKQAASELWPHAQTIAAGLRVPKALGDFIVLDAVYRSHGAAVAVTDEEILAAVGRLARREGILACPEGAATLAALPHLFDRGVLKRDDSIVLFNTGSGLKYLDVLEQAMK
ncbi:MAG TPA: threonine synthase [Candidatus Xenobia bacterium]|nr:threonine synthase [Candidatus Xenobia bacterium]